MNEWMNACAYAVSVLMNEKRPKERRKGQFGSSRSMEIIHFTTAQRFHGDLWSWPVLSRLKLPSSIVLSFHQVAVGIFKVSELDRGLFRSDSLVDFLSIQIRVINQSVAQSAYECVLLLAISQRFFQNFGAWSYSS